ncbi:MAG: toll/interleukin-1 receptor domain-containing protein [Chloroflexi bacterium]|nr:toll/interleukin-1 receptor domain-containing protein [Chloroflexota bacterium]
MKNFFISYTSADRAWAEWIAFELERANYSVTIQAWDFRGHGRGIEEFRTRDHCSFSALSNFPVWKNRMAINHRARPHRRCACPCPNRRVQS